MYTTPHIFEPTYGQGMQSSRLLLSQVLKREDCALTPYPTLPYPTLPYPTLPYPSLPYPTLPYPTLPYPTLPNPTMTRPKSYSVWGQITQKGLGREAQWKGKQRESSSSFPSTFSSLLWRRVDLDSYANCAHLFVHEAFCCCSTFNSATELSTLPILVCRMLFTNEPDNLIYCTV